MSKLENDSDVVKPGKYVIIQRQDYIKLQRFTVSVCATLGRERVALKNIANCKFYSTFKMVPKGTGRDRLCSLEKVDTSLLTLKDTISISESGADNRNIQDDGCSQKLTKDEIIALKEQSLSSTDIVETLISNSNTFHSKTEYSQDKYLKKKEKKYFEYIQIRKPTIRLIADILYRLDPSKILGIRSDTLSQILTYSNVSGGGNNLLYDSGSNGLVSAAMLNAIGAKTAGHLIHLHPGNSCQEQGLLAMNFENEQLDRCISVNLYSVMRHYYQNESPDDVELNAATVESQNTESELSANKRKLTDEDEENPKILKTKEASDVSVDKIGKIADNLNKQQSSNVSDNIMKKNNSVDNLETGKACVSKGKNTTEVKKQHWELENERACDLLKKKVDSLVIVCKEHPLSVFTNLLPFVNISRPFVIYHSYREPLQECFIAMRKMRNVVGIKLTYNWMRGYQCSWGLAIFSPSSAWTFSRALMTLRPAVERMIQDTFHMTEGVSLFARLHSHTFPGLVVAGAGSISYCLQRTGQHHYEACLDSTHHPWTVLPDRTHPDVLMQGNSGYLLTGWIVQSG